MLLRYIKLSTVHYAGAAVCLLLAAVTAYEFASVPAGVKRW